MDTTTQTFQAALAPLTAVIDAVPDGAWDNESPCEGWTTRDVVAHLVTTERDFFARHDLDLGDPPDVDTDPAAAWREHAARVAALVSDGAAMGREFDGYFGPTTVGATFEQFFVWDLLVHRWDIATAAGLGTTFDESELARMEAGAEGFGEALYSDGVCRSGVQAPEGASRQARVLARLGRAA